jgi:hypothetical protein
MPNFTYLPGPEDPETVSTHGSSFTAGEWTPIPDDHPAIEKLRGNRFFAEQGTATNGNIPSADPADVSGGTVVKYGGIRHASEADEGALEINKMALNGSELHDSGSGGTLGEG